MNLHAIKHVDSTHVFRSSCEEETRDQETTERQKEADVTVVFILFHKEIQSATQTEACIRITIAFN